MIPLQVQQVLWVAGFCFLTFVFYKIINTWNNRNKTKQQIIKEREFFKGVSFWELLKK